MPYRIILGKSTIFEDEDDDEDDLSKSELLSGVSVSEISESYQKPGNQFNSGTFRLTRISLFVISYNYLKET